MKKTEIDVRSLESTLEKKEKSLQTLSHDQHMIEAEFPRMKALERAVQESDERLGSLQKELSEFESQLEHFDEVLNHIGGESIQQKRQELEEVSKKVNTLQKRLSSARVQIRSSSKLISQLGEENERIDKDVKDAEQAIQAAKVQFERIEEEAKKVLAAFEEAKKMLQTKQTELEGIDNHVQSMKRTHGEAEKQLSQLEEKLSQSQKRAKELQEQIEVWNSKMSTLRKKTWENTRELDDEDETPIEDISQEERETALLRIIPVVSDDELAAVERGRVERCLLRLEGEKERLRKTVNLGAIREFRQKDKEWRKREKELDKITCERDEKRREFDELRKKRLSEFMEGFNSITLKLKEMYQMITLGGDAELELVDSLDPFAEGIVFSVRPPKKSWKTISNLSGGEKTLSSLALVFALHHYKPTPLYIMDEIDAALDFRNVSIVAHYIKERTKNAQFIVISLRNNMFEMANRLVGIYKTDNCTDSVTINPQELAQLN